MAERGGFEPLPRVYSVVFYCTVATPNASVFNGLTALSLEITGICKNEFRRSFATFTPLVLYSK